MKPRELLIDRLNKEITPELSVLGFRFAKSSLRYSRTIDGVKQYFFFSLSKWNRGSECAFNTYWRTALPSYSKWHLNRYGEKTSSTELAGEVDWNFPGWPRSFTNEFMLTGQVEDHKEMKIFLRAINNYGIPYLQDHSDVKIVADSILERSNYFSYYRASDFYLIIGEEKLARKAIQLAMEELKNTYIPEKQALIMRENLKLREYLLEK